MEINDKQKTLFGRIKSLRNKPTPAEVEFRNILDNLGIKYIFQKAFIKDYYCIVDFYLPKPLRTVVEIDGGYHNEKAQVAKDERRDKYLIEDRQFKVVRITNEEVFSDNIGQIIKERILNNK